jgi:hypothetical protein
VPNTILKWCAQEGGQAEGIGQALHYAGMTGKRTGLVLIIERPKDRKYLEHAMGVVRWHGQKLDVWILEPMP